MNIGRSSLRWLLCLLCIAALGACGGGDGDDDGGTSGDVGSDGSASQIRVSARAGDDRDVIVGTEVRLDGSKSRATDERSLNYAWRIVSRPEGSDAGLTDARSVRPSFRANVAGDYTLELSASAGDVTDTDRITITATRGNTTPVAEAGDDQSVTTGVSVRLDGTASHDADDDRLAYRWRIVSRPDTSHAGLKDADSDRPTFVPDQPGRYLVELRVTDDDAARDTDQVTVIAADGNSAPSADAGRDQSVRAGDAVTLDGTASRDADNDVLDYAWRIVSRPRGSAAALADPNRVLPSLTTDLAGDYVIELEVSDGQARDTDRVVVTAGAELTLQADTNNEQTGTPTYADVPNQVVVRYTIEDTGGQGVADGFVLRRLQLRAIGQSFTVQDLNTSLIASSNDNRPTLRFSGLSNGDIVMPDSPLAFSNTLDGVRQSGEYRFAAEFTIAETGLRYRIRYIVSVE